MTPQEVLHHEGCQGSIRVMFPCVAWFMLFVVIKHLIVRMAGSGYCS